jgi:hypothetical protein
MIKTPQKETTMIKAIETPVGSDSDKGDDKDKDKDADKESDSKSDKVKDADEDSESDKVKVAAKDNWQPGRVRTGPRRDTDRRLPKRRVRGADGWYRVVQPDTWDKLAEQDRLAEEAELLADESWFSWYLRTLGLSPQRRLEAIPTPAKRQKN